MFTDFLKYVSTPIPFLQGVGPVLGQRLSTLSLKTFWDCLAFLPRNYNVYTAFGKPLQKVLLAGEILSYQKKKASWRLICHPLWPGHSSFSLLFFRPPPSFLTLGSKWIFGGTLSLDGCMPHPEEVIPWKQSSPSTVFIRPMYSCNKGLSSKKIHTIIGQILDRLPDPYEWLDNKTLLDRGWPSFKQALEHVHRPVLQDQLDVLSPSRIRLSFDEYTARHLSFLKESQEYRQRTSVACPASLDMGTLLDRFGCALTACQKAAWTQISSDLNHDYPMMRLLHGEVGSGKTLLALLAMAQVVGCKKQACLLAPTELLARQHIETLKRLMPDADIAFVLSDHKKDLQDIAQGRKRFVIGTHALFQDPVIFSDLALVVIDEQQRFGVAQRLKLTQKGSHPHLLLMSATPIPRSFELALSGGMSVSRLLTKPFSSTVSSYVMPIDKINDLVSWIQQALSKKQAIYWVCPKIGEDDPGHSGDEGTLKHRFLFLSKIFPDQAILLHGQMKNEDKVQALQEFREGHRSLLVTTTIIETGIHIDRATTMVIENSHRFGLAQLHQLRGRVGRSHQQGHCFFLYTPPISFLSKQRLSAIRSCHDGFVLSEKDWHMRGGGDRFGLNQSGQPCYRFIDPDYHRSLMPEAALMAQSLIRQNSPSVSLLSHLLSHRYRDAIWAG